MITIKHITPPTVDLYSPDGTHLGNINEYSFLDARVQIKKQCESGYYIIFKGKVIKIDKNGELEYYPNGLLDTMSNLLLQLF